MAVVEHTPPGDFSFNTLEPLLFLAGPIQGAPDWQSEALAMVRDLWKPTTTLHVVNPRWTAKSDEFVKSDQITWEKQYLKRASFLGGLIFYLAAEVSDAPAPNRLGRAYAQTTRQEFGRAAGWKDNDASVVMALGMDASYTGSEDYYRHTADEFELTVHDNLAETCAEAVSKIEDTHGRVWRVL